MAACLAVYAVVLLVLVAGPWGWALNRFTVRLYVLFRYDWPIAPDWALPEHYGVLLNVVLFVPLGALALWLTRWPWWVLVAGAALVSGLVELGQVLLDREPTWVDVAANTLGALLGVGVALLVRRGVSRRAGRPAPAATAPRPR